jgi:hypothetical protein
MSMPYILFIKTAPKTPSCGRGFRCGCQRQKKCFGTIQYINEMLKRVQHDSEGFHWFVIPNLFRDLGFWPLRF